MALTPQDIQFLESQIAHFKEALFHLISEFGPEHNVSFILSYEDIRNFTGRIRLTTPTLGEYHQYLANYGFYVQPDFYGFQLSATARSIVTVGNEAIQLSNALRIFRDRAILNGDVSNY